MLAMMSVRQLLIMRFKMCF